MTFSITATGHAVTKEAEAEVVKLFHELMNRLHSHTDGPVNTSVSTTHHGTGSIEDVIGRVNVPTGTSADANATAGTPGSVPGASPGDVPPSETGGATGGTS